jgi:hypothetical protein
MFRTARRWTVLPLALLDTEDPKREIGLYDRSYKPEFEMRSLNLDQLRTLSEVIALGSFSAGG